MTASFSRNGDVFQARRDRFATVLEKHKLDGFFMSAVSDLYYLTGFQSEGFYGLFTTRGAWLFCSALLAGQVRENTRGCRVVVGKRLSLALEEIRQKQGLKRVGFDPEQVIYRLGHVLAKKGLKPGENPLAEMRAVKEEGELDLLRKACRLTARAVEFVKPRLRLGVTELQLAREIESFFYRQGAGKVAFDLIVAMGPHTALPHHVPGETRLARNQPVIFDIGCTVEGYRSDLTRTLFYGKIHPILRRIYNVAAAAQKAAMERVRPGATGGQVDAAARGVISRARYGRYFIHSTGHGVGLDIHEPPWIRPKSPDVLAPGMVLTAEPGIYLPGRFGVRIEDTLLVTPTGHEVLTK